MQQATRPVKAERVFEKLPGVMGGRAPIKEVLGSTFAASEQRAGAECAVRGS